MVRGPSGPYDQGACIQRVVAAARSGKPGSKPPSNTAMVYFRHYCAHAGYTVPTRLADDPLEVSHDGSPSRCIGRLAVFAGWLRIHYPKLAGVTIEQYVSGVRSFVELDAGFKYSNHPALTKGLKRFRQAPSVSIKRERDPATLALIRAVVDSESVSLGIKVGVLVAYKLMLRGGEYTSAGHHADPTEATLCGSDVRWSDTMGGFAIRIPHSKADIYNAGVDKYILPSDAGDPYCPVLWLRRSLLEEPLASVADGPFFVSRTSRGTSFVTVGDISRVLKAHCVGVGLDPSRISSHSLRIGAAFELANAGVSWPDIGVLGRWSPSGLGRMELRYARMPVSVDRLRRAAAALSLTKPVSKHAVFPRC